MLAITFRCRISPLMLPAIDTPLALLRHLTLFFMRLPLRHYAAIMPFSCYVIDCHYFR